MLRHYPHGLGVPPVRREVLEYQPLYDLPDLTLGYPVINDIEADADLHAMMSVYNDLAHFITVSAFVAHAEPSELRFRLCCHAPVVHEAAHDNYGPWVY